MSEKEKALTELTELSQNMGLYDNEEDKIVRVLDQGFVRLVDSMGDDAAIVQAARVSYGKGTKKVSEDEALIRYLLRNKHTTPFEMVEFKFHIKAPIFVFRQWHRHRMWSYNEYSGRYSEMKDEFYLPTSDKVTKQNPNNKQGGTDEVVLPGVISGVLANKTWEEIFKGEQVSSRAAYENYLKTGMRKELARINLPLAQYSEMYAKVDLHNLFHFLKLRMDSHAQYEIRVYGDAIAKLVKEVVPVAFSAFEDYVLGSLSLSKTEVEALRLYIQNLQVAASDPEAVGAVDYLRDLRRNKREMEEFNSKLSLLVGSPENSK